MSKGFVIYASGLEYVKQAYICAISIKEKENSYPVTVVTCDELTDQQKQVFDDVVPIPWHEHDNTRYQVLNRWKTYHASPYDETIVLDADTLVTQNIDDWWNFFSKYELFFPSRVYTYRGELVTGHYYRKAFVENNLPSVYTGIHYFRKDDLAYEFFKWLELISNNWELFYGQYCKDYYPPAPSMDVSTAIAIKILELDQTVTNNKTNLINFVHMKERLQGWPNIRSTWLKHVGVYLTDELELIIGNHRQRGVFHYVDSDFLSEDIYDIYEKKYFPNKLYEEVIVGIEPYKGNAV